MKASKLDEIKKELEKVVEFREGTDILKDSFYGEYQGTSITLAYRGNYSNIWLGKIDKAFKIDLAMSILDCDVEIKNSKIRFRTQDCVIAVGE